MVSGYSVTDASQQLYVRHGAASALKSEKKKCAPAQTQNHVDTYSGRKKRILEGELNVMTLI